MNYEQLISPRTVKAIMDEYQLRFKKRFGQNFLVDRHILEKIVAAADLTSNQYVLEIGTGLGTLTHALAQHCHKVVTMEIDPDLIQIFTELNRQDNIKLIAGDALASDWQIVLQEAGWKGERLSLVANLPYYITSPLIMKALESSLPFASIVVMVQKEVAQRLQAAPQTKDYGLLTLIVNYYADVEIVTKVPRTVFIPPPEVDSAVVKLTPRPSVLTVDKNALFAVMRSAFGQRRKTLKNTLKPLLQQWGISAEELESILDEMHLSVDVRGEALSLDQFGQLTQYLLKLRK